MKRLLANMMLWQKFALLGLLGVILFGVPTALFVSGTEAVITSKKLEIAGVEPVRRLLRSVQLIQQHRGMSAVLLSGDESVAAARQAKAGEVDQALQALDEGLAAVQKDEPRVAQALRAQKDAWIQVRDAVAAKRIAGPASFAGHSAVVAGMFEINSRLQDYFRYTIDPDFDSTQLINAAFVAMPSLTEDLGRSRARGAGLLVKKEIRTEDRLELAAMLERARDRLDAAQKAFGKAAEANPALKDKLGEAFAGAGRAGEGAIALAREQVLLPQELGYASDVYFKAFTGAIDEQFKAIGRMTEVLAAQLDEQNQVLRRNQMMVLAAIFLLAAVAAWLGVLITRSVTGPVLHSMHMARQVAACDLTVRIHARGRDETAQLLGSLNEMTGSLGGIVGNVRDSIDVIQVASREIATGNADLSRRTESQAASLEETASAMEELTSTVQQNADNARQANQLADAASKLAARGGEVVGGVVQTMGEIKDSSARIVDIISVIDGIAFQTNILALNAAVEAARAGEQGRGFAVVASEVRSLAQRSATAAREIKELIGDSVQKVDAGGKLVDEAGATMGEIVGSVRRVAGIMSEITSASHEQSIGIAQVNDTIAQMEAITQQNAALVEEAAAAAESLQKQAELLWNTVSVFRTADGDDAPRLHAH
ncbi:methyl-accepting chemotaxis protein [Herbaspirillum sp. WKF16]|uniref:methyl-accepting chemotaxis protein n=1 Tax=Herbaspirillum sp. WKF16 TaxID=3028312 RepID=UPI0023A9ACAD|nr:methyl-accepting chemotaxis protein [Herbaspirillum sp. WKF16]WDZ97197.1 methyl-accepting chemotaxis protein [Herbaspirillum sp. WKF16]